MSTRFKIATKGWAEVVSSSRSSFRVRQQRSTFPVVCPTMPSAIRAL